MAQINHKQVIGGFNQLGVFGEEFNQLQKAAAQLQVVRYLVNRSMDIEENEQEFNQINQLFDELTKSILNQSAKIQFNVYLENVFV